MKTVNKSISIFDPYLTRIENTLNAALPNSNNKLHQAMRYSCLNSGKRIRPLLVYATVADLGCSPQQLDYAAAAIELIHTYSLIHDDLPTMDDDDLRRGKPSCHKQFDPATAILAGDALNTLAFNLLTQNECTPEIQIKLIQLLSEAAGPNQMILGQSLDLAAENQAITIEQLEQIHTAKTGALIQCSIQMAASIASASAPDQAILIQLGETLGLTFQLQDDLLDIESSTEQLGKPIGSDQKQHKATFPSILGQHQTRQQLNSLYSDLQQQLSLLSFAPTQLSLLITSITQRAH